MSVLLDTNALLWWLAGDGLGSETVELIADPGRLVAVSAVSIWEAEIKRSIGKLRLDFDGSLATEVVRAGLEPLAISLDHAERAGSLPAHHRDPFDRMLIAQAQIENLAVVTRDSTFAAYDVDVILC